MVSDITKPNSRFNLKTHEAAIVDAAMTFHKGNKKVAAQSLGISYKALFNKLHAHHLFDKWAVSSAGALNSKRFA